MKMNQSVNHRRMRMSKSVDQLNHVKSYDELELKLHPLDENEFIGTVLIEPSPKDLFHRSNAVQTVILLDKSGSMADAAQRMSNEVIPLALLKLGYKRTDLIHFITFESRTQLETVTVERLKSLPVRASGGTNMAPAIKKCHNLFSTLNDEKPVRLLTISDGRISDQVETEKVSSIFVDFLKLRNFTVNSQAVRLFTSLNQPDTTAVCSLLQLNNSTTSQLADISADEDKDVIAEKIMQLFENDNLGKGKSLTTELKIIFKFPWDSTPSSSLSLLPGKNVFWLKGVKGNQEINVKIGGKKAKTALQPPLTLSTFQSLMDDKMLYIVDHMKILKIVGTDKANRTINAMLKYFEEKESFLSLKAPLTLHATTESLNNNRMSALLGRIAKDEKIATLDSAQRAEYLRMKSVADDVTKIETAQQEPPNQEEKPEELEIEISEVDQPIKEEQIDEKEVKKELIVEATKTDETCDVESSGLDETLPKQEYLIALFIICLAIAVWLMCQRISV